MTVAASIPENYSPAQIIRAEVRAGSHKTVTANLAHGFVQANLAILPSDWADEFEHFCLANPKPCPLLARGEIGSPHFPTLGANIDVRTDVPCYRVFENGIEVSQPTDIRDFWHKDLVAFAIGCSYSFEWALLENEVPMRHLEQNNKVCTYRTNIDTTPRGRFAGKLVVSMRNFTVPNAIRAIEITSRYPQVHGAPIHFGDPSAIGIVDINQPEYGGRPDIRPGEIPLFWACGVTPQSVIESTRPPFCITHKAGHLLVTDRLNEEFRTG